VIVRFTAPVVNVCGVEFVRLVEFTVVAAVPSPHAHV